MANYCDALADDCDSGVCFDTGQETWSCNEPAMGKWRGRWYCERHLNARMSKADGTGQHCYEEEL
jgi:hypothetical protein